MDWIDVVLIGYLVLGALYGLRRGLVLVAFSLAGYVGGVIVAEHVQKPITAMVLTAAPIKQWVEKFLPAPAAAVPGARVQAWHLAHGLTSLLIFLLIVGATEFVGRTIGVVISQGVRVFRVTAFLNRLGGVVLGLAEHGVVAGLVLSLVLTIPALGHSPISQAIHRAPLAGTLIGWFGHIAKIPGGSYL